eukprot:11753807-Alexandrium_andersonii.AAC.1
MTHRPKGFTPEYLHETCGTDWQQHSKTHSSWHDHSHMYNNPALGQQYIARCAVRCRLVWQVLGASTLDVWSPKPLNLAQHCCDNEATSGSALDRSHTLTH